MGVVTPKHPAIAAFQNIELAFCGIFAKQDVLDTRVNERMGNLYVSAELPRKDGERIAEDVRLDLERIAMEGRP